jgi:hypothetical protein
MPLRSDILRGVRLAAVAFVLVLVGALVYRSVDISAKHRKAPVPQVVVAPATPPASVPPVIPDSVPTQAIPKQGGLVAQTRGTGVRAANTRTQNAPAAGSQAEPETEHVTTQPAEPPPTDTAVSKEVEVKANAPEDPPLATMPDVSADGASSENRGKRMIKAVGRFLRIGGKKEVEPQPAPARPKPNQQ